jgi:hypothetical protein
MDAFITGPGCQGQGGTMGDIIHGRHRGSGAMVSEAKQQHESWRYTLDCCMTCVLVLVQLEGRVEGSKPLAHASAYKNNQHIENRQNSSMNHGNVNFAHRLRLVLSDCFASFSWSSSKAELKQRAHANENNQHHYQLIENLQIIINIAKQELSSSCMKEKIMQDEGR